MGLSSVKLDSMITLVWEKDDQGNWLAFETNNIDHVFGSGVCVVWYEADPPVTVCVGHGDLPQVLHEFIENRAMLQYRKLGTMRFTYAELPERLQRGVARYVSEQLQPVFGDVATLVLSIAVNLPE